MRRVATALALLATSLAWVPTATPASAQEQGRISGVVRSADTQRPLSGAQVFIQGTRIGGLSNQEGRYLINGVPAGTHQVRVTIIGYAQTGQTVTVAAGQTVTADFSIAESAVSLEGLVVTGTAKEVRAREVGSALDAVTSRELENVAVTNAENILAGRVPGLTVLQGNGQPGAGTTVRIRAQTTVSSTTDPLIYVDGVRIFHETVGTQGGARLGLSPLQDIAAEDIERIEVIKGASAATLYGTEASGGVIQIFTKRGVSGAPIWNAEVTQGINNQPDFNIGGDPWDIFTKCGTEMYGISMQTATYGQDQKFRDVTCPSSGRWFSNGPVARYSLSVRGGSGGLGYFVSMNYNDEDGTLPTQNAKLGGMRVNLDFSPAEDFKVQVNSAISMRDLTFVEDGNSLRGFLLNVGRGYSGNYLARAGDERCAGLASDVTCFTNEYIWIDANNWTRADRFTTGLTVQHDATENLTNRLVIGWDFNQINNKRWQKWGAILTPLGNYANSITYHQKLSIDYAGTFSKPISETVSSAFSWGGQIFRDNHRRTEVSTNDFAGPGVPTLSSGGRAPGAPTDVPYTQTNAGIFLQEVIGYQDLLFLTLGLRVDGNSAFGDDFGLEKYPKASVAYVISDYGFWPTSWWETMKLRGAFGYSGRAPGAFDKLRTWSPISDDGTPGFSPRDVGNSAVGPERTREIEVGFDASMFQGIAGLEFTYYNSKTTDALVGVSQPGSEGGWGTRTENVGELMAEGIEMQVNGVFYRSDFLEWRGRANVAFNRSEAQDLNCADLDGNAANGKETCQIVGVGNGAFIRVGHTIPTYWGWKIMNPDEHAAPIRSDSILPIGPVMPTRLLGFSTSLSIGDYITVDALLEHQGGHYLPNFTGYQNERRGVWYNCYEAQRAMAAVSKGGSPSLLDPYTALERARCATNIMGAGASTNPSGHDANYWIDKADFWKLRSVSVSFQFPEAWIGRYADRATFTLAGRNLIKWTDFEGTDPEIEDYSDRAGQGTGAGAYGRREYYSLPPSRQFLATLRVTF
ncbi:MAG TPA: SusC/RagA family TonB-linked outer membrane protein [Longimicrobiales bacterium]|nr:SusC/RagA family TonB-linked outer membrane protein [Longimicrobiales bacterium]